MRNLITGGCGFIGSNLIDRLINNGEFVICIDDLSSGSLENISKYLNNKNFVFIENDITNTIKTNLKIDRIWHLACPASPIYYQLDPIKTSKINFEGTLKVLKLAQKYKSKILFASSSEVYGNPRQHPQEESYYGYVNPIGLRSCYDEGKRIAESLFFSFYRTYKLDIKIARIFNTYGPNMSLYDGRVVSNFICQSLLKKPFTIYGDGSQSRSFCYIDDLTDGLIKLMNSNQNGPINLGNPEEISIMNLASLINAKVGNEFQYEKLNLPEDDPIKRKPNISKAAQSINWSPNYSLSEGLDLTIEYFQNILKLKKNEN